MWQPGATWRPWDRSAGNPGTDDGAGAGARVGRDREHVALATRRDNEAAFAFYEDAGLECWGHVMERALPPRH